MDDTYTMFLQCSWEQSLASLAGGERACSPGLNFQDEAEQQASLYGRRLAPNESNDFDDRPGGQRNSTFTGIEGVHLQDQAVTESMGTTVDHTIEHLTIGDLMITRTRQRMLLRCATSSIGMLPGAENSDVFLGAHGGDFCSRRRDTGWLETLRQSGVVRASANPTRHCARRRWRRHLPPRLRR